MFLNEGEILADLQTCYIFDRLMKSHIHIKSFSITIFYNTKAMEINIDMTISLIFDSTDTEN